MQNITLPRNVVNPASSANGLHKDLLKICTSELENQLTEKNLATGYLTKQLITKFQNTSVNQNSRNTDHNKEPQIRNSDKVNDGNVEICNKKSKDIVIIRDSMLNNINGIGLSKWNRVEVLDIPGATNSDIVEKIDNLLDGKPKSLIVYVRTIDLTKNVNLLSNVKKY